MGVLAEWLGGQRSDLLWIDFTDYGLQLFGGGDDVWQNAAAIAALMGQAQGLIQSEVVALDAGRILLHGVTPAEDALGVLMSALQDPARLAVLAETVDACAHGIHTDLVLQLPSPSAALACCGADAEAANDFGNLDDTGAAYTDVIRSLAGKPLTGLVFQLETTIGDDEIDALGPVVAAADHYDWPVVVLLESGNAADAPDSIGQGLLLPNQADGVSAESQRPLAGGLVETFWRDGSAAAPSVAARYGRIPAGAVPETVLAQLSKLR